MTFDETAIYHRQKGLQDLGDTIDVFGDIESALHLQSHSANAMTLDDTIPSLANNRW